MTQDSILVFTTTYSRGHSERLLPSMLPRSPKVGVIIPTYNRADLIGETIYSVLEQTYSDLEVLVVDDGFTGVISFVDTSPMREVSNLPIYIDTVEQLREVGKQCLYTGNLPITAVAYRQFVERYFKFVFSDEAFLTALP